MAEAVLDDVEGVLDDGAHLRERPLDRLCQLPQCFRQGFDDAALERDVPADVAILKFRPLVRPGVAGIAEDIFLLSMQQRRRLGNVGFIGGSAHHRMDQARGDIDPDMGLHPEVPLIALLRLVHLRITALLLVLRRRRGGNDGRIDDRPVPHQQAALLPHRPDLVEQPLCQIVPFQPMPEMQYRSRVRHRVAGQRDPGKAAQRLAVVERVLDRFIGQPVPLLPKIDPQHALQRDRRPTALAFRIERGQACHQPGPRHRLLHLGQKLAPPLLLLFAGVLRLGKTPLTLHRSAPGPTPGRFYPIPDPKRDYFSASLALATFFTIGAVRYGFAPARLDEVSVHALAKTCGVSQRAIDRILQAATQSTYFHSPDRYSAYVLFSLGTKFALRPHRSGVAVFVGGMTEVLADPIADCIRLHGGTITAGVPVQALICDGDRVSRIKVASQEYEAKEVILATSLGRAKQLVLEAFGQTSWNKQLLDLPTMPAIGLQIELDAPATAVDRPTFVPGTCIAAIAEQSRTTFRKSKGRVSILLAEPEQFLSMSPEKILSTVCADAQRIGIELEDKIRAWRLFVSPDDFYFPYPGSEALRPAQRTPVRGLTLAGDYTKQPYMATMEGAVLSGKIAADLVLNRTEFPGQTYQ